MSPEFVALSDRVAALEPAVARLQAQLGPQQEHWLDRMSRGVTDVEAFEEAMRLGREFRQSYRDDIQPDPQP